MMAASHPEFAEALNASARAKGGLFLISEVWRLLVLCLVPAICDFQAIWQMPQFFFARRQSNQLNRWIRFQDHHGEVREWLLNGNKPRFC